MDLDNLKFKFKMENPDNQQNDIKNQQKNILKAQQKKEQVNIPQIQEFLSKDIFFEKKYLNALLQYDLDKNFQRTYIQKLPTLLYTFEQKLNEGDTLLVTLNPDKVSQNQQYLKKNNYITPSQASEIFDLITETSLKYPLKRKFLDVLKKSFLESFLQLKDYEGDKKEQTLLRDMHKKQKSKNNNFKQNVKKKKYDDQIKEKNIYDKQEQNLLEHKNQDPHIQNIKNKGQTIQGKNQKLKEVVVDIEEKQQIQDNRGFIPQPHPLSKENQIKKKKKVKDKSKKIKRKVKYQKLNQEEDEEDLSIKKIVAGGGFMKYNSNLCIWEKTEACTLDFMTLLRQTIYILLAYQGIIVREFVTSDGNFIASVCYAYDKNLKLIGQQKGFFKQCDLSMVDMLSLEPVDYKYRPLRFNIALINEEKWKQQNWFVQSGQTKQQENIQLRLDLIELLNDVKIHTLPRKCNALNDKSYFYDQETEDIIQQHSIIPKSVWLDYKTYLQNLKLLLQNINEQYLKRKKELHKHFFSMNFQEEEKKISLDSQRQIQLDQIQQNKSEIKISRNRIDSPNQNKMIQPKRQIRQKVTYVIYKKFIKHNQSLFKIINNKLKKRLGNAYVKALLKSYKKPDQKESLLNLSNIWMRLNIKPLEPYVKFYLPSNKRRPRVKDFFENLYRDYSNSKFMHNNFFSSVEKISIMDWQVNNAIDMGEVSKTQRKLLKKFRFKSQEIDDILQDVFFPLHNYYQLTGKNYSLEFQSLLEIKENRAKCELQNYIQNQQKINIKQQNQLKKELYLPKQQIILEGFQRKIRANFSKEQIQVKEERDKNLTNLQKNQESQKVIKNPKQQYKKIKKNKMKLDKIIWPISKIFYINFQSWIAPWTIQSKVLINYFGEKLAMYFQFTIYFVSTISPILIIGIICWIINFIVFFFDNNTTVITNGTNWYQVVGTALNWVLGFSAIIWSCYFYYEWDNQERIFRIKNGLSDEIVLRERMNFQNFKFERSLVDDFVNNKKTQKSKIFLKIIVSILITLFILSISFGISIGFFYLKNYFVNTVFKNSADDSLVNYKHNIVNAMETIKIILFDHFYYYIAVYLVEWIDPKYTYEFESILIGLITFFGVLNNYFMIFFIILFKDLFMDCATTNIISSFKTTCLIEAELLFRTYIVFHFFYTIIRVIFQYLKISQMQSHKQKIDKIRKKKSLYLNENQKKDDYNQQQTDLTFQDKQLGSSFLDQQEEELLYNTINQMIEQQIYLEISNRSDDFDTTIIHYYQIFNQFAALILLSLLFSLAYLFVFVTLMIELILDRKLYFKQMRRISPYSSSTIGNWKVSLQIVGLLGILTNGYTLTFEYSKWFLDEDKAQARIFMLIVFILVGTVIWLIGKFYKSKLPKKYRVIQERQNFIIQTIKNNQREKNSGNDTAKVKLNIQPLGEIDYNYFEKLKERKKKKILKIK